MGFMAKWKGQQRRYLPEETAVELESEIQRPARAPRLSKALAVLRTYQLPQETTRI